MPNKKTHILVGCTAGALTGAYDSYARQQNDIELGRKQSLDIIELIGESLFGLFGGYIGGRLPDIIEPAYNPHHRGTAHSFSTALILIYANNRVKKSNWHPCVKALVRGHNNGYLSHIALDSQTPMSVPMI